MNKKRMSAVMFLALFLILIVLLKFVDVQVIGPQNTSIGLATLNGGFHKLTGEIMAAYTVSKIFGILAIALAGLFALTGLYQLIKRRKVDREILCLGCLYAAVIVLYVLFDKIVINYRPMIEPGETELEPSFPSTHTMLAITIMISAVWVMPKYIRNRKTCRILTIICYAIAGIIIFTRLLCGVHWFTDIVGSILLSGFLLSVFSMALDALTKPKRRRDPQTGRETAAQ